MNPTILVISLREGCTATASIIGPIPETGSRVSIRPTSEMAEGPITTTITTAKWGSGKVGSWLSNSPAHIRPNLLFNTKLILRFDRLLIIEGFVRLMIKYD